MVEPALLLSVKFACEKELKSTIRFQIIHFLGHTVRSAIERMT